MDLSILTGEYVTWLLTVAFLAYLCWLSGKKRELLEQRIRNARTVYRELLSTSLEESYSNVKMFGRGFEEEIEKLAEELDNKIEKWHEDADLTTPLPEYLGMSDAIYAIFVTKPSLYLLYKVVNREVADLIQSHSKL